MKKKLLILTVALMTLMLSACYGARYTDEEKKAVIQKGGSIIKEVLPEGCELLTLEAYIETYPSGPSYLTDYVQGIYKEDGEIYNYLLNIENEKLYSSKYYDDAVVALNEYALEILDLDEDVVTLSDLSFDFAFDSEVNDKHATFYLEYLPIEVTDVSAYIRDPEREEVVRIHGPIYVTDGYDLSYLDMETFETFENDLGFKIYSVWINEACQQFKMNHFNEIEVIYESRAWADKGDFKIFGIEYVRYETESSSQEMTYDLDKDYTITRKGDDYVVSLNNVPKEFKLHPEFVIYAEEGSDILSANYETKDGHKMKWVENPDGTWELSYRINDDGFKLIHYEDRD